MPDFICVCAMFDLDSVDMGKQKKSKLPRRTQLALCEMKLTSPFVLPNQIIFSVC